MQNVVVILVGFLNGYLFELLHVPAGWLLGAIAVGAIYRLFIADITFPPLLFDTALAIIGVSISLSIKIDMFKDVAGFLLPQLVSLVTLFVACFFLAKFLHRFSNLDAITALFCCLPAGASVMIALSREYKAKLSIVAAFQSVRIMMLVTTIPIIAGYISPLLDTQVVKNSGLEATEGNTIPMWGALVAYTLIVMTALALAIKWKIPVASFIYSIMLGFLVHSFAVPLPSMPDVMVGGGMAMLGVIIGARFDRESVAEFKRIGWTSLGILTAFFVLTFITTFIFYLMTPLDFTTSLLAIVPAGAAQMASVAALLDLDASIVAAIQVSRLVIIIITVPMIVPFLVNQEHHQQTIAHNNGL
ncbi:hypothetical protein GCM10008983_06930 [Lentibacillus halophilus]|uniref:Membrane protein AbrB duplication n=1 Tax=Lentibacillus halophilus TaxID=295065 RepID=A0ABN0Z4E6_9BACI